MRRNSLLVLVPVLLCAAAATPAMAQRALRYTIASGAYVDPTPSSAHLQLTAALPTRVDALRVRLDALVAADRPSAEDATSATANLVYSPGRRPLVPYGVAGAGITVVGYPILTAGLGWDLPFRLQMGPSATDRVLPLYLEWRGYHVHGDSGALLSLGARL